MLLLEETVVQQMYMNFKYITIPPQSYGSAMAQAVSHWPVTVEARVSIPLSVHVRFEVDTVSMGQAFLQV